MGVFGQLMGGSGRWNPSEAFMQFRFNILTLTLVLAACSGTPERTTQGSTGLEGSPLPETNWIEGSPVLEREIAAHVAQVPNLQKPEDFVREVEWFVRAGEPAFPTLLDMARNTDPKVAGFALAVMSACGDSSLVPHLETIPWTEGDSQEARQLRYERARCHVKLGDWKPLPVLVEGLDDEYVWNRALCFKALREETGQTFDYHPRMEGEERAACVARWQEWLEARRLDPYRSGD